MSKNVSLMFTVILVVLISGCTTAPVYEVDSEWVERKQLELEKARSQFSFSCVPSSVAVRYAVLFYTPWDKLEFQPVAMSGLSENFLYRVIDASGRFKDLPEVETALKNDVNALLNKELSKFKDGTYNAVYVRIGDLLHLGVAPVDERTVHVWIPEDEADSDLTTEGESDASSPSPEEIWVFDVDGNLVEHHDANAAGAIPLKAWYHKGWTAPHYYSGYSGWSVGGGSDGPRATDEPLDGVSFWTFASWPTGVKRNMIDGCMGPTSDTVRH